MKFRVIATYRTRTIEFSIEAPTISETLKIADDIAREAFVSAMPVYISDFNWQTEGKLNIDQIS